ncbi:MAG: ATP-binding protein [Mogibacterium sp.]|nr:ATP-binding protein [Mogibacterium sp.]
MSNWLSEGTVINGNIIKSQTAEGEGWQICRTAGDQYVIAVDNVLMKIWSEYSDAVPGFFSKYFDEESINVFCAAPEHLVSSLDKGPYPDGREQIEAFTDVFCSFLDRYPEADLRGAIYIEEHDLLLPVRADGFAGENGYAFGKWITRGVNVSIEDTATVHRLISWLPEAALRRIADRVCRHLNTKGDKGLRMKSREDSESYIFADLTTAADQGTAGPAARKDKIPDEDFHLPGSSKLEKFFNEEIVEIIRRADEYKRMGIGFPGAVVLYGPPGTGKTFAVERLAEYLGWPRYDINSDSVGSTYIHETSMKIARIFDMAISNAPSVIVIDEMEAYLSSRSGWVHQHHVEEVSEFLRKIPEAVEHNVLVFAMTNMIKNIDPAILRRGRFDHMVEVGYADRKDIRDLLEDRKKKLPIDDNADLNKVAGALAGKPMSDVAFVIKEAGRYAVKNRQQTITTEAFEAALRKLPAAKKERSIGFSV